MMPFEQPSSDEKPIRIDPESAAYKKLYREGVDMPMDAIDKSILRILKAACAYVSQSVDGINESIKEIDEDEVLPMVNEADALHIMFDSRKPEAYDVLMNFFRNNLHFSDRDTLEKFERRLESIPMLDSYTPADFAWIDESAGIAPDDHETAHVWFRDKLQDTIRARGKFQVPPEIPMENLVISLMNYVEEVKKDFPESSATIRQAEDMFLRFSSEGDSIIKDVLRHQKYQTPDLQGVAYATLRKMSMLLTALRVALREGSDFDTFLSADQILIQTDLSEVLRQFTRDISKAQRERANIEIPSYLQRLRNDTRNHIANLCANVATGRNIKDTLTREQNQEIKKTLENVLNYTEALCYPGDLLCKRELSKAFAVIDDGEIMHKLSEIYRLYKD